MIISSKALRQYHEAAYGQQDVPASAFKDLGFEEYYQLMRIKFPQISQRRAAEMSEWEAFRCLASRLPEDPPEEPQVRPRFLMLERKQVLDLFSVEIGSGVEDLALDRIKLITGWEGLRLPARLKRLTLTVCGASAAPPLAPPVPVEHIDLIGCSPACVKVVLGSTVAQSLQLLNEDLTPVNLALLRAHHHLTALWLEAPIAQGVKYIESLPLKRLRLSGLMMDMTLRHVLEARSKSLESLGLSCLAPFGPFALPELPALRSLEVPAYENFRAEWIEWAVAHPQVACSFPPLDVPAKRPLVELEEVYRNVAILRIKKGKQVKYEVAANLVEEVLETDSLDNGKLEDMLKPLAKQTGQRLEWASESDTLVVQAKDIKSCRWVVDSVHELKDRKLPKRGRS